MQELATQLNAALPLIPSKPYFSIGEVSELCAVKPHVLRNWEQVFPRLKPIKRRGNRRYYQRDDVVFVSEIRALLYEQGYTIDQVQQKLLDDANAIQACPEPLILEGNDMTPLIHELEKILVLLGG